MEETRHPNNFRRVELHEFCAVDHPHYFKSGAFVAWCDGGAALGVFGLAPQRLEDIRVSARLIEQVCRNPRKRALMADARNFGTAADALAALFQQMPWGAPRMAAHVDRVSLVLPAGWSRPWWQGLIGDEAWRGLGVRLHQDTTAAAAWLGIDREMLASVDQLADRLNAANLTARAVEPFLRLHPTATVEAAARANGTSVRSLQRLLADAGTSFAEVRARVRLAIARHALSATEVKVEAVASKIGFASRSHFVRWFRALTGSTPSKYRRIATESTRTTQQS